EIAAYRLDRLLGLDLVPVTVTRQYSGKSGSVQYFIARPSKWKSRKTSSRLNYFDYLIANPDRNSRGNYLIFPGRPYEIAVDHGKAFSTDSLYSEIENLKSITPPKEDFQRLKKLEDDEIRATLT